MQPEDLQQPGVCRPPGSVCQPGLRGRVPADPDVHHPHELRQGLGSRVQVGVGVPVPGMRGLQVAQNTEQGLPRDELGWPFPHRAEGPGIRAGPSPIRQELSSARPVLQFLRTWEHSILTTTLGGDAGIVPVVRMRERRPREGKRLAWSCIICGKAEPRTVSSWRLPPCSFWADGFRTTLSGELSLHLTVPSLLRGSTSDLGTLRI